MKKNIHYIISGVLTVAIAVLYVLYFMDSDKPQKSESNIHNDKGEIHAAVNIAYLNIDTVIQEYDMYYKFKEQLEAKTKHLESELNSKTRAWEREAADFQDKAQKGLLLRSEMQEIQQKLAMEQQNLYQLGNEMSLELAEEEQVMNRQLIYSIMEFLKQYNKQYGYKYILGTSFGGNILYANDSLDITQEVLKGLNEKYAEDLAKEDEE